MSPSILSAVTAGTQQEVDVIPIARALVSVSDKTGIVELATFLASKNVELLSTGGTAKALRDAGLAVIDVSDFTGAPECLDGRVKTLHPKVHGGILGVRGNATHESEMAAYGIQKIDMVILNLYAFEATVASGGDFNQCIENIDIGGPSMLRSTAKNHAFTTIVTNPDQYKEVMSVMQLNNGGTTLELRRRYASRAFALSASYDSAIASWFMGQLAGESSAASVPTSSNIVVTRAYKPAFPLKYGCNPHQNPAMIYSLLNHKLPFDVLNGTPGYINLLDAANAWQLVKELREATGYAAASSFKHVSPAGAAVAAVPLSEKECAAYEIMDASTITPVALAYLRARNADPMCSFGDFAAVSDVVDEATALILKKEVSDGIVAPGFTPSALDILMKKKGGKFIILQATAGYEPEDMEYREVYGMTFAQKRNGTLITKEYINANNVVTTEKGSLDDAAIRDMIVASICVKYTQSNSVGFAKDGMMVGVGAGQQSRVDCVKLAGRKVRTWFLRQHPKVLDLQFLDSVKRQDRVNARVRYIEGDLTTEERIRWEALFSEVPCALSEEEKDEFIMKQLTGVTISSDAFFPFRDSIDHASKLGVTYVVQPGGSIQDKEVTAACEEYGMTMCMTNLRLFHH